LVAWLARARLPTRDPLALAALVALLAAGVHGVFDVALYGARTFPALGVVAGLAAATPMRPPLGLARRLRSTSRRRRVLAAILAIAAIAPWSGSIAAAWQTNLGAISQMRAELAHYDAERFDDPSLDEIRRSPVLDAAERRFERALEWRRYARAPLQRLTEIALARGHFAAACGWIGRAWDAGHRDTPTRLLHGDCLVASGRPEEASVLLAGLHWAASRLHGQAWYRYWSGGDWERAADAWDAVTRLEPRNRTAAHFRDQARELAHAQRGSDTSGVEGH
jgi:hypothetical protein